MCLTRRASQPILWSRLLVALWARVPDGLDAEGEARTVLHRFLWRAFLTDRYEKAVNTRALADYRALRALIANRDEEMPPIFDDDNHPVVHVEDIVLAGWPKKKDRLGRAVMLISLRAGGLDLADGSRAKPSSLQSREYHHLFPVSLLSGPRRRCQDTSCAELRPSHMEDKPQHRGHVTDGLFARANRCIVSWRG